ncbi:CDP-alcohol phosphatidyltransferase family protein [Sphingomonas koreensis]|nr:CDP-alcohol phosphatidyltransferase family protein [Sphingomonas koreensis]
MRFGISANIVSLAGLTLGAGAAVAYSQWQDWRLAFVALALSVCWLIADGLDGMIARATKTASPFGRILDGLCDHGVFALIYLTLAASIGTAVGWALAIVAATAHAVQSSLYEAERARFHRRLRGAAEPVRHPSLGNPLVRFYDAIAGSLDRHAARFDAALRTSGDAAGFGQQYGRAAAPAMKAMSLLSANVRVIAIFLACLAAHPALFWWFEIVPLSLIAIATIAWHRRVERSLLAGIEWPAGAAVRSAGLAAPE